MHLTAGTRLGPYEITTPLGAGGMGEVYRARDTKLNHEVALKILPDAFASDAERIARFTREAQTLATLNHPHIAQIYGVEESSGVRALVMELIEGEDLAARIARGAIPIDEALAIAKQIAEALEAAHDKGIIHRDLKPANIKLAADGTVKVLDFGFAKALWQDPSLTPQASRPAAAATVTSPAMTAAGMLLGTAAYMAPEQARGKPVDKRADIWAFGCVLYEMLTARRLFERETVSEILVAVLNTEIDWDRLPASTPRHIRALLRRCLDRDARQRLRDIGEARIAIETADAEPGAAPSTRRSLRIGLERRRSVRGCGRGPGLLPQHTAGICPLPLHHRQSRQHGLPERAVALSEWPVRRRSNRRRRAALDLGATARVPAVPAACRHRGRPAAILVARQPGNRVLERRQAEEGSHGGRAGTDDLQRRRRRVRVVSVDTRGAFKADRPRVLFTGSFVRSDARVDYDVSADGRHFLMLKAGDQDGPAAELVVLLNWAEELARLVPTRY